MPCTDCSFVLEAGRINVGSLFAFFERFQVEWTFLPLFGGDVGAVAPMNEEKAFDSGIFQDGTLASSIWLFGHRFGTNARAGACENGPG